MHKGAFAIFSYRFVKSLRFFSTPSIMVIFILMASCSPSKGFHLQAGQCADAMTTPRLVGQIRTWESCINLINGIFTLIINGILKTHK